MRFLAIDIGGSKTIADVFEASQNGFVTLNEMRTIGVGFATDCDEIMMNEFQYKLRKLVSDYDDIASCAINLGGKNTEQIYTSVEKIIPNSIISISRESEGSIPIELCKMHNAVAVLLAGTGCIAVSQINEKRLIFGGWGANIGDGGSGYDIGLNAIKTALSRLDGREPLSPIMKEITGVDKPIVCCDSHVEIMNIRDRVREKLYPLSRENIASYAKLVSKYADLDDKDAVCIMNSAGKQLAGCLIDSVRDLDYSEYIRLIVTGGLLGCKHLWQKCFVQTINNYFTNAEVLFIKEGVLSGAKALAVSQYKDMSIGGLN